MKRSKIILGILILSVMALVLSGCGGGLLSTLPPLEENDTYALGDIGPAGGYIFYDKGSYSDGWRYLEAAPASTEWTTIKEWGSYNTFIGGTEEGIGTGQSNTTIIVAWLDANEDDSEGDVEYKTDRAAYLCDALVYGGYSDWFLPSKDELNLMYENLKVYGVGGFGGSAARYYWSSSEASADEACYQNFGSGGQGTDYKSPGYTGRVRAVRAFRSANPTYLVNYNANGATEGTVPYDSYHYEPGETVTVLDNTGNLVKTGWTFAGWNTAADGTGTDQAVPSDFDMGSSDVTLYAKWTPPDPYSIGDVGPAGGLIFYDDEADNVDDIAGARYLEAAPIDQTPTNSGIVWAIVAFQSTAVPGGTLLTIGSGSANTDNIIAQHTGVDISTYAAGLARAYKGGDYDDWFLPSKDELNLMYTNLYLNDVGGFADDDYWSSSEDGAWGLAWNQSFYDGVQGYFYKYYTPRVRAVRAF